MLICQFRCYRFLCFYILDIGLIEIEKKKDMSKIKDAPIYWYRPLLTWLTGVGVLAKKGINHYQRPIIICCVWLILHWPKCYIAAFKTSDKNSVFDLVDITHNDQHKWVTSWLRISAFILQSIDDSLCLASPGPTTALKCMFPMLIKLILFSYFPVDVKYFESCASIYATWSSMFYWY